MKGINYLACLCGIWSSCSYANWYADVNLGANFVKISKQLTYPIGEPDLTLAHTNSAYNSFHGQLALGYNYLLTQQWQLALEGDVDFFSGHAGYSADNWFLIASAAANEKLDYGWGLFLLPSWQMNEQVQFFAGPGISSSRFVINTASRPTAGEFGVSGTFSSWLTAWGFKAGTSIAVCPSLDVLLTYQFTDYNSITRNAIEPFSENELRGRYQPQVNMVMLGFKYVFGRNTSQTMLSK